MKNIEILKDVLQGENKGKATAYDTLKSGIKEFFKEADMKGEVDLSKPETLSNISILVGNHNGYKLVKIQDSIDAIYQGLAEDEIDNIYDLQRTRENLESEERRKKIAQSYSDDDDEDMFQNYDNDIKSYKKDALIFEQNIREAAAKKLVPLFMSGRIAFQNQKKEIKLMDFDGEKLCALDPEKVQAEISDPDTRSCFRKFIDAVKEFFGAKPIDQDENFIKQKDVFEFQKAQKKLMGKEKLKEKVAQEEKQSNSAEKDEPKKEEPKKEEPKKEEPKKEEPEKSKGKGM